MQSLSEGLPEASLILSTAMTQYYHPHIINEEIES